MTAPKPGPRTGPLQWFARGGWYPFMIVMSLGMLSFVPFVHAALRLRRALAWLWAGLYSAAVITLLMTAQHAEVGGWAIGLMIIASVHSLVLRRQVWPSAGDLGPAATGPAGRSTDPAVDAVLAARARREESRRLAATDPLMAHELHIGRPDLSHSYDDGGLVDLNSAPAPVIAQVCGIELDVATLIVDARSRGVSFAAVEDVFAFADIPYPLWDRIRDRAVVIAA
jgi:hypothetical protein